MSRIAKKPIVLPNSVTVNKVDSNYLVKGKLGELFVPYFSELSLAINDNNLSLVTDLNRKDNSSKAGLLRSLLSNAVYGVENGYKKILELKGLGYRCSIDNNFLVMSLGFSHKVNYSIPSDVKISVEKDTIVTINGLDKQRVGQVAAEIRSKKVPDNYHAKGILYQGETIITKEGKKK